MCANFLGLQDHTSKNIGICFILPRICHWKFEEDILCPFRPWRVNIEVLKLKYNGYKKHPPPNIYTICTLIVQWQKAKCTFTLEDAFRA